MVLYGVFEEYGASGSSSSGWMVGVVHCIVAEFEIALVRQVGFRDEHDVNVVLRDERLELGHML
jgi:hypothetical protein